MRKAIFQLLGGNLFSKILGLLREIVGAALFGTGPVMGAYRVALTGTLSPVNFFTSDSLNSAFVPQYKAFKASSTDKAQTLFWLLFSIFGVLAVLIGAGLWFAAESWVTLLAPGLDAATAALTSNMLKIMGVGVPFYLLSAILVFLAMANEDFVPLAIRATVQNLGMLLGAALAYELGDVMFLAWGFTCSYMVFSVWVLFRMLFAGFLALPSIIDKRLAREVILTFWRTMRLLLLLPFLLQGNIMLERMVASLIGMVAISALDYARFVTETLLVLVATPVAFAGLTHWSGLSPAVMRERLQKLLRVMLLLSVPVSIFLSVHAHRLVEVIYARGKFNVESVAVTGDILFGIAIGLWSQVIGYVFIKGLNAQLRNRVSLLIMAVALMANSGFNFLMYPYFGAMTLGFGNSVYGLVMLGGTLTAFGLWRDFFSAAWIIVLGGAIYLGFNFWLPVPENIWLGLAVVCGFTLIFWSAWIALIPALRKLVLDTLMPKRKGVER